MRSGLNNVNKGISSRLNSHKTVRRMKRQLQESWVARREKNQYLKFEVCHILISQNKCLYGNDVIWYVPRNTLYDTQWNCLYAMSWLYVRYTMQCHEDTQCMPYIIFVLCAVQLLLVNRWPYWKSIYMRKELDCTWKSVETYHYTC